MQMVKGATATYLLGLGDGTTTAYQLKVNGISITSGFGAPSIWRTDWQGKQLLYSTSRTNLVPVSEPQITNLSLKGGTPSLTNTTLAIPVYGTANALQYPTPVSVVQYGYQSIVMTNGATYSASCIVLMSDASQPVLGQTNSTGDFSLAIGDIIATGTVQYQSLGSNMWRVTLSGFTAATYTNSYFGAVKYPTQSTKGLTVSCLQLEQSAVASSYIKTSGSAVSITDYSINSTGNVTLAVAGIAGPPSAIFTWAGYSLP